MYLKLLCFIDVIANFKDSCVGTMNIIQFVFRFQLFIKVLLSNFLNVINEPKRRGFQNKTP